jgi:hypothetical protein
MQGILGIFNSRAAAEKAVQGLLATRISPQSIVLLSGEVGRGPNWIAFRPTTPSVTVWEKPWGLLWEEQWVRVPGWR